MTTQQHIQHGAHKPTTLVRNSLAIGLALALAGISSQADAISFGDQNGFNGTINTTLSYGIGWRTEDPADNLVGKAYFDPMVSALGLGSPAQRAARGRYSVNGDDGDVAT